MEPKNKSQLKAMEEGGKILSRAMEETVRAVAVGITTLDLDKIAAEKIAELGGGPSFTLVPGYHWATCMCVNDMVVHGIPTVYRLKDGDILGIDAGVYYQNFHTDMSWSVGVGKMSEAKQKFLLIGQKALIKALEAVRTGNRVGHISSAIEQVIEIEGGYSVTRQLVGHGVGRKLHEEPQIPGVVVKPLERTPQLLENQTLAIEVIYAQGKGAIAYKNKDGWTIVTKDGSLSGLFEVTVAVTKNGPKILTPFARLLNKKVYGIMQSEVAA